MKILDVKVYVCEYCGYESKDKSEIIECEGRHQLQKLCKHKNIQYQDKYEMKSKHMYCVDCGKTGSRIELERKRSC